MYLGQIGFFRNVLESEFHENRIGIESGLRLLLFHQLGGESLLNGLSPLHPGLIVHHFQDLVGSDASALRIDLGDLVLDLL